MTNSGDQESLLEVFKKNNSHCEIEVKDDSLKLKNPWGSKYCGINYKISETEKLRDLNSVVFRTQYDALIHTDTNEIEFFFGYTSPTKEPHNALHNRAFKVFLNKISLECRYDTPTERLFDMSKRIEIIRGEDRVAPQLEEFNDACKMNELPQYVQEYFKDKKPLNFFVKPSEPVLNIDLEQIAMHINFLSRYYDRRSPVIVIRQDTKDKEKKFEKLRFLEKDFPVNLSAGSMDNFILQLLEAARDASPRMAFIYYYQILEYAGFYFIDEKVRKVLRHSFRDPAMIDNPDEKIAGLFATLTEFAGNEDARMKKVLEELCDYGVIWKEIEHDKEFFTSSQVFNGGVELPPLISKDITKDSWVCMCMPKLYDQLTKIRNCLVHARERRQGNFIHPTIDNNKRIRRWLPIISRVAEQIALKQGF